MPKLVQKILAGCSIGVLATLLVIVGMQATRSNQNESTAGAGGGVGTDISEPGTIFDVTTDGTATTSPYSVTIPWAAAGRTQGSFVFENMANATVTIYGSNDTVASSSVKQFTDITSALTGASTFTSNRYIFVDTNVLTEYLRFSVATSTSA